VQGTTRINAWNGNKSWVARKRGKKKKNRGKKKEGNRGQSPPSEESSWRVRESGGPQIFFGKRKSEKRRGGTRKRGVARVGKEDRGIPRGGKSTTGDKKSYKTGVSGQVGRGKKISEKGAEATTKQRPRAWGGREKGERERGVWGMGCEV